MKKRIWKWTAAVLCIGLCFRVQIPACAGETAAGEAAVEAAGPVEELTGRAGLEEATGEAGLEEEAEGTPAETGPEEESEGTPAETDPEEAAGKADGETGSEETQEAPAAEAGPEGTEKTAGETSEEACLDEAAEGTAAAAAAEESAGQAAASEEADRDASVPDDADKAGQDPGSAEGEYGRTEEAGPAGSLIEEQEPVVETVFTERQMEAPEVTPVNKNSSLQYHIKLLLNDNGICTSLDLTRWLPGSSLDGVLLMQEFPNQGTLSEEGVYTTVKAGTDRVYAIKGKKVIRIFHINSYCWGAHRGYSARCTENTEEAFIQAALAGADAVEADIRRTKDDHMVCFHDSDTRSKTNSRSITTATAIENMTYEEVQALVYNGTEDHVCSFERLLEICREQRITPILHMKVAPTAELTEAAIQSAARVIREMDMVERVTFNSQEESQRLKEVLSPAGTIRGHIQEDESPLLSGTYDDDSEDLASCQVLCQAALGADALEYNGKQRYQSSFTITGIRHTEGALGVTDTVETLTRDKDFKTQYFDNIEIGTATLKFNSIGGWIGRLTTTFKITKIDLADAKVKVDSPVAYTGTARKPEVTVSKWVSGVNMAFREGTDYTLTYKNNVKIGEATVTVRGKGSLCTGTATGTFKITAPVAVTKLELDKSEAELATTKKLQLTVTAISPWNATDRTVTWSSDNAAVASVDKNGLVTAKKYGRAVITARASSGVTAKCLIQTRFYDVDNPGKSYYKPVYWAVDKKITVCTTAFRPDLPVTRGEFVAFLWRLAGKPACKATLRFSDVNTETQFYDAIRWAVGKGIIKGYGDQTFRSEKEVTRGETATMLWRYAGKPAPVTKTSPFSDIRPSSADSYRAILWGSENRIILGNGGKFLKDDGCTRGQTVTFLYRYAH